jgi:hypothetical protein
MTKNLKARIKKLEKRAGTESGTIPVEVFDRILAGAMNSKDWQYWGAAVDKLVAGLHLLTPTRAADEATI